MKKISIFMCLFWMGFIFYMSSNNGQISHEQSTNVVNLIENTQKKLEAASENKIINEKTKNNKNTSSVNEVKESDLDHIVRKNAHAFMYMILAFLVSSTFFAFNRKGRNSIIYILFIGLFYSVTDEFHQSFVPGRTSLVSDILVDFGGALIGLIFFYLFYYIVYERYALRKNKN